MLTGKYLKYTSEINLEIFTLVWNKLKSLYPSRIYDWTKDWSFESFRKNGYISIWGNNDTYSFGINNNKGIGNKDETTVQEILGYDPFVKDDFVLPEKWCIKIQANGIPHEVAQWRKSSWTSPGYILSSGMWNCDNAIGYTEITLEQFKKYVLKESIEIPKEVIPEYVECIKEATCNTKVGEIFKCRQLGNCFQWEYNNKSMKNYNSWDGWYKDWSDKLVQEHFKPSTKEAYDAQNQPKQPLKQAVHCKTQEEWDFVLEKLNYEFYPPFNVGYHDTIDFIDRKESFKSYYKDHQILSFQEWCDLNGYKMEKKVKFEVGDYVILRGNGVGNGVWEDELVTQLLDLNNKNTGGGNINPDFNFKYKNYIFGTKSKYIIRHATPEEVNNHLISIGQIPAGELLSCGVEPNKDGMFKYTTVPGTSFGNNYSSAISYSNSSSKPKMTLSIDDEELPMVNIIKTNSIKQLLNVE